MEKVRGEIADREARFPELAQKSRRIRLEEEDLDEEIRILHAGEDRRGSCESQSNGCCFAASIPPFLEQLFTLEATHARQQTQALQEEFNNGFEELHGRR